MKGFEDIQEHSYKKSVFYASFEGRDVVVKHTSCKNKQSLESEFKILNLLKEEHVPKAIDIFQRNDEVFLVLQRIYGDKVSNLQKLSVKNKIELVRQLFEIFIRLECNNIIYRDLCPDHLLLVNNKLYLIDFGNVHIISNNDYVLNEHVNGFQDTMAPEEKVLNGVLTHATNVYSLAAMTFWIFLGNFNYCADSKFKKLPHNWAGYIKKALSIDVARRPNTVQDFYHCLFTL